MVLKIISYIVGLTALVSGVVYLNVYDDMTREPLRVLWVDSAMATDLRNILDEFTDETNITVHVEGVPPELFRETLEREVTDTDRTFDIVVGDMSLLANDVSQGWYESVTPLVRDGWLIKNPGELVYTKTPPQIGEYYAVPVVLDALGVAYSKEVFRDVMNGETASPTGDEHPFIPPPQTLEDMIRLVSEADGKYRLVLPSLGDDHMASMLFFTALLAQGVPLYDSNTSESRGYINSPKAVQILEQLRSLVLAADSVDTAAVLAGDIPALTIAHMDTIRALIKGRENSFVYTRFLPVTDTVSSYVMQHGASLVSGATHRRAAEKFLAWWQTERGQDFWDEQRGFLKKGDAQKALPLSYQSAYEDATKNGVQLVAVPNTALIQDLVQKYISAYLSGESTFTAQQTLDTIVEAWDKLIKE